MHEIGTVLLILSGGILVYLGWEYIQPSFHPTAADADRRIWIGVGGVIGVIIGSWILWGH